LVTGFIKGGITVERQLPITFFLRVIGRWFSPINYDDVKDILKSLQIGKALGGDFISHQMLKNTADTVLTLQ
jgi:hypothetical protein